jgi:peptidoglycan hydrolase FlgJ
MAISPLGSNFYADPAGLSGLKREAAAQTPEAVRETARQFESLFTTMMLKSMRDASPGDSMFGSEQQDFYQDMFDQQLSVQLSKGRGLGLADVLVRQLQGTTLDAPAEAAATASTADNRTTTGAAGRATAWQGAWPPQSHEQFVEAIMPAAEAAGRRLGVDPSTIVAQAALETGWGRSLPTGADGRPSFNLFGIKSGSAWRGDAVTAATTEFENGRMQGVNASFRAYESPAHSLNDYADFLSGNPRYAAALGTGSDADAFGRALQKAGYATDPDYARKLGAVARELKSRFPLPISSSEA